MKPQKTKVRQLTKVSESKIGKIIDNNIKLEAHEYNTILLLIKYGFTIELIKPINTPKSDNPDFLMMGTIWEMKSPKKFNKSTIKKRIKKASKQASHIVFDLRKLKATREEARLFLVELFEHNHSIRRMILIVDENKVFDFLK